MAFRVKNCEFYAHTLVAVWQIVIVKDAFYCTEISTTQSSLLDYSEPESSRYNISITSSSPRGPNFEIAPRHKYAIYM